MLLLENSVSCKNLVNDKRKKCASKSAYGDAIEILLKIPQKFLADSLPSGDRGLLDNARVPAYFGDSKKRDSRCCGNVLTFRLKFVRLSN